VSDEAEVILQNTLLFIRMLRQVGLPVSLEQTMDYTWALTLIDTAVRNQVFHAASLPLANLAEPTIGKSNLPAYSQRYAGHLAFCG
jgi:uncharacterized protein with von Willebrand factor type A (vWA) domain